MQMRIILNKTNNVRFSGVFQMKFDVSFNDDAVVFVNTKTNKAEKVAMVDIMGTADAIGAIASEQRASVSASAGAVSLLAEMLNNPRFDSYKGTTPLNESIPKELKAALRDIETEFLKPVFIKRLDGKGNKPATIEAQWQKFAEALRAGGSYAVAKGKVLAYFAHCGELPVRVNSKGKQKCLTVAAIDKLLQNARDSQPREEVTMADKLAQLALTIAQRSDEDGKKPLAMGNPAVAIKALEEMLATYQGLLREETDAALVAYQNSTSGDVTQAAAATIGKAKRIKRDVAMATEAPM